MSVRSLLAMSGDEDQHSDWNPRCAYSEGVGAQHGEEYRPRADAGHEGAATLT